MRDPLRFDILTIFPEIFDSYLKESLVKRAQTNKLLEVVAHDLRDFSRERHRKVDDRPFGGGPGMVLMVEPIWRAVQKLRGVRNDRSFEQAKRSNKRSDRTLRTRVILFSTRGKKLDSAMTRRLAKYDRLVLICGRYEGVDERVAAHIADEEVSIGDYVLSGGELPALVLLEAVSRHLPGFLGKTESLEEQKGSYPVYTRPAEFKVKGGAQRGQEKQKEKAWRVPKVLLSGDHQSIREWRERK